MRGCAMAGWDVSQLVQNETGLVGAQIFSDPEIYQQEMVNVFQTCWLFVGHESMVRNPGDYLTTSMGEDNVIVCRDADSKIRVYLNRCRHRGNAVCLFDRGNARAFTCTYHGWTYSAEGKLTGLPFSSECYLDELNRDAWGLVEVPRVDTLGGLIFACWDPRVMPLRAYLGSMAWYLENFLTVEFAGGLEIIPGTQKYVMPANWKLTSDNFAGDHYHFASTHAAYLRVFREYAESGKKASGIRGQRQGPNYEVSPGYPDGVPHAVGQIRPGPEGYEDDLRRAAALGPDAVEWVKYRYERLLEQLRDHPVKPYCMTRAHVFPNFSQIGLGSALEGRGLITWVPRGPNLTEAWQWCAVEKDAPRSVKALAAMELMHGQSAAGLIAPDDHENFERMTDNVRTPVARSTPFNYQMGLGHEEDYPGHETWEVEGLPGLVGFHTNELNQRQFYRYWSQLMSNGRGDSWR